MPPRLPVIDWTTDFDHLDPQWTEDPYPIWGELQSKCPIAHTERYDGVYLATRYDDVRAIAYDTEHFSSRRIFVREGGVTSVSPPVTSDPPEHRGQRMLLMPAFTPSAIATLEPRIRDICRDLAEDCAARLAATGHCDGARHYAQDIPVRVTALMLGISPAKGDLFRRWLHEFFDEGVADPAVVMRVIEEATAFFAAVIAEHRASPGGSDLVSFLLAARLEGQPLSDAHINGTLRLLLFAGIDTTWSALGSCLWHLARHDEDCRRLAAEPSLIPRAVEEFLRVYAPVTMAREIVKETEIAGCRLKAGEMVMLAFPAANRDPAMFTEPDQVNFDRTENQNRQAAFGLGIHRCVGAHLARLELTIALEEWLRCIREFILVPGSKVEWSAGAVRGPRSLPFQVAFHESQDARAP